MLSMAVSILKQYQGFSFFSDLEGIFLKLEKKVFLKGKEGYSEIVQIESVPPCKGEEYIQLFIDFIKKKTVLKIIYKKFESEKEQEFIIHPYLLKEYKNRWYLIGLNHEHKKPWTLALDRIIAIEEYYEKYIANNFFYSSTIL